MLENVEEKNHNTECVQDVFLDSKCKSVYNVGVKHQDDKSLAQGISFICDSPGIVHVVTRDTTSMARSVLQGRCH